VNDSAVDSVPFWWHSIDLGNGVVTPGRKTPEILAAELDALALPDLRGKTVLDVGGWDGFFAFEAERRGAARVAVLDHYMWAMDVPGQQAYWRACAERGVDPLPYEETEYWHPDTMPGRRGFEVAQEALRSSVEALTLDFTNCDLASVGRWDVVLYLGVLYHMQDPLGALRRLRQVTGDVAIVETEAVATATHDPYWRFFPRAELNHDSSNWWAPNLPALIGALESAGFSNVVAMREPPAAGHYRTVVHAR
jgi:tRNA (mo5U34)-methyltransferase